MLKNKNYYFYRMRKTGVISLLIQNRAKIKSDIARKEIRSDQLFTKRTLRERVIYIL